MEEIDEATLRNRLKAKRDSLFDELRRNPSKPCLAIEIRLIDDQIATLTEYLTAGKVKVVSTS